MPSLGTMTDRITHLLRPLRQLWRLDAEAAPPAPARSPEPTAPPGDLVELDRILILLARPAGNAEPIRLMTRNMSLREALFLTKADLAPGQDVLVQMLLEPGFALQVHAYVAESRRVDGECRGRLTLTCGPFERGALTSYLAKRNARPL